MCGRRRAAAVWENCGLSAYKLGKARLSKSFRCGERAGVLCRPPPQERDSEADR